MYVRKDDFMKKVFIKLFGLYFGESWIHHTYLFFEI